MTKILEATNIAFDGVSYPYVPPARLNISPKLKLHNDWTPDVCLLYTSDAADERSV